MQVDFNRGGPSWKSRAGAAGISTADQRKSVLDRLFLSPQRHRRRFVITNGEKTTKPCDEQRACRISSPTDKLSVNGGARIAEDSWQFYFPIVNPARAHQPITPASAACDCIYGEFPFIAKQITTVPAGRAVWESD